VFGVLAIIIVGFLIIAAAGGFFWWQHYKTTPAYSLALLVDAVERNDTAVADQLIDTDKILANLTSQVTEKAASRYGSSLTPAAHQRLTDLIPGLLPGLKQNVRDVLTTRIRQITEKSAHRPFIVTAIGLPYLVNITTEGNAGRVTTKTGDFELTMEHQGERWKVVSMKDETLVQQMVDNVVKQLPAVGELENPTNEKKSTSGSVPRRGRRKRR